jgi:putative oxidoreductase
MRIAAEITSLACRWFLAGLFLFAAHDKVWDPSAFAAVVARYELLPLGAVNAASAVIAWLELILGVLMALGLLLRPAALWSAGLLALFTGLMIYAGLVGAGFDCGCFPGQASHQAGLEAALRDLLFLLPALWLMYCPGNWLQMTRVFP